jgi:hypothetical protein
VLVPARPTTPFYVAKQRTTYLPSAIRKNAAQLQALAGAILEWGKA